MFAKGSCSEGRARRGVASVPTGLGREKPAAQVVIAATAWGLATLIGRLVGPDAAAIAGAAPEVMAAAAFPILWGASDMLRRARVVDGLRAALAGTTGRGLVAGEGATMRRRLVLRRVTRSGDRAREAVAATLEARGRGREATDPSITYWVRAARRG
jgi:hypothetical protein